VRVECVEEICDAPFSPIILSKLDIEKAMMNDCIDVHTTKVESCDSGNVLKKFVMLPNH